MISHPNKSLQEHLDNTCKIGMTIFERKIINCRIFEKSRLKEILRAVFLLHDIGKSTKYFQEYMSDIQAGIKNVRYKNKSSGLKRHGFISAAIAAVISKAITNNVTDAFIVFLSVLKHHGDLQDFPQYFGIEYQNELEAEEFQQQFESIDRKYVHNMLRNLGIEYDFINLSTKKVRSDFSEIICRKARKTIKEELLSIEGYLIINLIFSILIYSDKTEAIFYNSETNLESFLELIKEEKQLPPFLVDNYIQAIDKKDTDIFSIREEASKDIMKSVDELNLDNKILSINLPTGSGKTLTAIKSTMRLRERLKRDKEIEAKIIYLLPFTSIVEQNYSVLEEVVGKENSSILLKHHHLSEKRYIQDEEEYKQDVSEHLFETWESEIVVSTFAQFMHSIFSNKNKQLKKFHNIANSIVILDEVQTIPFKYWGLTKEVFIKMAETLNCYFILMTATMPLIFSEEKGEILELASNKPSYFKRLDRMIIDYSKAFEQIKIDEFIDLLKDEINSFQEDSFLIISNTIKSSMIIYKEIKKICQETPVFYLSSNIVPKERSERIKSIKNIKGPKIVISTQLIEAGVDIALDRVYRDFGPIDSINQAAGRCNRNGTSKKGKVSVVNLKDSRISYAAQIYDNALLEASATSIKELNTIPESEIFEISREYYKNLSKTASDDEGTEIKSLISQLEYRKAFDVRENPKAFRLIDEKFRSVDLFIEADENAKACWEEYIAARHIKDRFERKKAMNIVKNKLNDYIISVPEAVARKHMDIGEDWIVYVPEYMAATLYDKETGFKRIDALEDYFF